MRVGLGVGGWGVGVLCTEEYLASALSLLNAKAFTLILITSSNIGRYPKGLKTVSRGS